MLVVNCKSNEFIIIKPYTVEIIKILLNIGFKNQRIIIIICNFNINRLILYFVKTSELMCATVKIFYLWQIHVICRKIIIPKKMMFFFVFFFHRQRSQLEIKTCKRILVTNSSGENYTTSDNNHAHSKTVIGILHSTHNLTRKWTVYSRCNPQTSNAVGK